MNHHVEQANDATVSIKVLSPVSSISDSDSEVPPIESNGNSNPLNDSGLIPMLMYPADLPKLPSAIRSHGAAYILSPPLPPAPLAQASSALFALPADAKDALRHPKGVAVRGYNSAFKMGREWWDYSPLPASPTAENSGSAADTSDELPFRPSTELSPADTNFVEATERYFRAALKLLHECISSFRSPEEYGPGTIPDSVLEQGESTLRYLRYSPSLLRRSTADTLDTSVSVSNAPSSAPENPTESSYPGMKPHTDHGILTLMTATSPSSLYIYTPDGMPLAAPPLPGTVLVISGDCLTHWTRDKSHRDTSVDNFGTQISMPTDTSLPKYLPPPYPPPPHLMSQYIPGSRPPMILPTPHEVIMAPLEAVDGIEGDRISVAVFLRPAKNVVLSGKTPSTRDERTAPSVTSTASSERMDRDPIHNRGEISSKEHTVDSRVELDVMTFGRWALEKGQIPSRRCWLVGRSQYRDNVPSTKP